MHPLPCQGEEQRESGTFFVYKFSSFWRKFPFPSLITYCFILNALHYDKQSQSARGRYVSAEKVQELFAQLGVELCAGRKRIRAARSDKSISIYVNGGTVNITFNEKGGKA